MSLSDQSPHNKALPLTARQHVSQVNFSIMLDADRAPQLKAFVC